MTLAILLLSSSASCRAVLHLGTLLSSVLSMDDFLDGARVSISDAPRPVSSPWKITSRVLVLSLNAIVRISSSPATFLSIVLFGEAGAARGAADNRRPMLDIDRCATQKEKESKGRSYY